MALFNRLKTIERGKTPGTGNYHSFGRYDITSDTRRDTGLCSVAKTFFSDGNIHESIESILKYFGLDNVEIIKDPDNKIIRSFGLLHGTRKLTGFIENNRFEVICRTGTIGKDSSGLYRLLLQNNSLHQYSTYAIDDNKILLRFCSPLQNLSPEKFYNGLIELSLKGDKMAQFLPCEFSAVSYENDYDIEPENMKTKKIKTEYLLKWTGDMLDFLQKHEFQKDGGIISCNLLNYIYRVDFLLVPWYRLLVMIDKMMSAYHSKDRPSEKKFEEITLLLKEINRTDHNELCSYFIRPVTLFDMPRPATNKEIKGFLRMQINDGVNIARIYGKDKGVIVFEHAAGYCFYNYLMNSAIKRLLFLFIQVLHPGFFRKLGFKDLMADPNTGKPDRQNIEEAIRIIITEEKAVYPYLGFFSNMLKYHTLYDFAHSFFSELIWLNFKDPDG